MNMIHVPLKIAHRGGSGLWPENTIEAFTNAINLGIDGIELDVHLSKDNILVVHHDEALKPSIARDRSGRWVTEPLPRIKDMTFEAIQTYDVGRLQPNTRYGGLYPEQSPIDGARIPSLTAVIDLIKSQAKPDFRLYLELKTNPLEPESGADPLALAQAAAQSVDLQGVTSQVTFIAFEWAALQKVKEILPQSECRHSTFPFAWIDPEHPQKELDYQGSVRAQLRALSKSGSTWTSGIDWRKQPGTNFAEKTLHSIKAAGGKGWFAYFQDITEETMAVARQLDLNVSAWTVDLEKDMQKMTELGVEAILTDRPDRLIVSV